MDLFPTKVSFFDFKAKIFMETASKRMKNLCNL